MLFELSNAVGPKISAKHNPIALMPRLPVQVVPVRARPLVAALVMRSIRTICITATTIQILTTIRITTRTPTTNQTIQVIRSTMRMQANAVKRLETSRALASLCRHVPSNKSSRTTLCFSSTRALSVSAFLDLSPFPIWSSLLNRSLVSFCNRQQVCRHLLSRQLYGRITRAEHVD